MRKPPILRRIRFFLFHKLVSYCSISTSSLLSRVNKYQQLHYNEPDYQITLHPTGNTVVDNHYCRLFKQYLVKGDFLVELQSCFLVSPWALPVTRDGLIVIETSGHIGMLVLNVLDAQSTFPFPEFRFIFALFAIRLRYYLNIPLFRPSVSKSDLFHLVPRHGTSSSPAFSHWIFENLPQVKHFLSAQKINSSVKLFPGGKLNEFQSLTLSLLGIDPTHIHLESLPYITEVSRLYLSRLPYIHSNKICLDPKGRQWVSKQLRRSLSAYPSFASSNEFGRLAVSRKYCSRRRIINEETLSPLLCEQGFHILYPEKSTELLKYQLFYSSSLVLALPGGSAFANTIFSPPGSVYIDCLPDDPSCFLSVWFFLSMDLNLDYRLIQLRNIGGNSDFRLNDMELYPSFPEILLLNL